ncbi:MAG: DUF3662 and FHA domain-containing protein [Actinobacteria bacterium]|nr:DUF3662 and FHA domain-containing protein [Actinomycetota bacterium]
MGILRDFEHRLEGAVEGFFARAFRSNLQPVELAKAIQRYAANYRQVDYNGVVVPNSYRFTLAPDDLQRFSGFHESLQRELADVVRRTAQEHGWRLRGRVAVTVQSRDGVGVGTYELQGRVDSSGAPEPEASAAEPEEAAPPAQPAGGAGSTRVLPTTRTAFVDVRGGSEHGRRFEVTGPALLGRLPECDITLADASVSRRHARIDHRDGSWVIEDLGSTNGMRVNDAAVGRARLRDGDRIELGSVGLAFSVEG